MTEVIRITGAVTAPVPNPDSPHDPTTSWIGTVAVSWAGEARSAALRRVSTGRGTDVGPWGQYRLCVRWFGDPPPPDIAAAVYDVIQDGGPGAREIAATVAAQPKNVHQHSYRPIMRGATT
jgi:hypothetical protein